MKLHRGDMNGMRNLEGDREREIGKERGHMVGLMYENGVWGAREAGEYVRAKVLKDGQHQKI